MIEFPSSDFKPSFLSNIDSWHGHVFFVRDLIEHLRPSIIVELGVHKGDSLFAIGQSCEESNLETKIFGIDHWKGDSQAGHLDEDVFKYVSEISSKNFKNIELAMSSFDEKLMSFKDQSIDLLHLDGFHSYDASKNDFENWLPKLKKDGIMLIHDVASKNDNFGVVDLWAEIKKDFRTIEFFHSQGLGVMFNREFLPKNAYMKRILDSDFFDSLNIYYSLCSTSLRLNKLSNEASFPYERQMFGSESLNVKKAILEQKKLISMPKFTRKLIELWQKF